MPLISESLACGSGVRNFTQLSYKERTDPHHLLITMLSVDKGLGLPSTQDTNV